ncbi:MAG: TetR/AcrR family transcriptional regulator [Rhodospirillaceae bacterium]
MLQAALSSFVSQGYHSTNLEQIAATAHLTKGAIYFNFGSKEAVLLELLKRVQTVVVDEAIRVVEARRGSFADRLVAYIHYQAGLGLTRRDEVLLLILMSLEFKERQGKVHSFIQKLNKRQCTLSSPLSRPGRPRASAGRIFARERSAPSSGR